ncbi:MAG: acyltransferase [Candidatus Zixiibacteriota bacterium]|nr:MAG: acyltransferase [candidate division Zixibacteria bacterium]
MARFRESIGKIIAYMRGYLLRAKIQVSGPLKSYGRTIVEKDGGVIKIGGYSCLWPNVKLSIVPGKGKDVSSIVIGDYTSIGDRTEIHCGNSVVIGNYVLISWDVNIIGYDYHAPGGGPPESEPIVIEDEVWIGARAIILKGVTIGKGAIIGAGSVVSKEIPPYSFAAGNPARAIKKVSSWRGSTED